MKGPPVRAFTVEYPAGVPSAVFVGNDDEALVLAAFLRETTSFLTQIRTVLTQALSSQTQFVSFGGNEVSIQANATDTIITAEWIADENGNPCTIRIATNEAMELLLRWEEILARPSQS
jgi:hypothetical protein